MHARIYYFTKNLYLHTIEGNNNNYIPNDDEKKRKYVYFLNEFGLKTFSLNISK